MNLWFVYVNNHLIGTEPYSAELDEAKVLKQAKLWYGKNTKVEFYKTV